jgi:hypothetical protein
MIYVIAIPILVILVLLIAVVVNMVRGHEERSRENARNGAGMK